MAAIAPIQPLAWELPYAEGMALKRQKKKKNRTNFERMWEGAGEKLMSLPLASLQYKAEST